MGDVYLVDDIERTKSCQDFFMGVVVLGSWSELDGDHVAYGDSGGSFEGEADDLVFDGGSGIGASRPSGIGELGRPTERKRPRKTLKEILMYYCSIMRYRTQLSCAPPYILEHFPSSECLFLSSS